ncbi:MAG TPA: hypothetical protein VKB88_08365 [Bryobacteraceae bacterium]|nr:hypothetical protein [Bryobacteraceae bacterium]
MLPRRQPRHAWSFLERHDVVAIFTLALLLRVVLLVWTGAYREPDPTEAIRVAHYVVHNGQFANPYPLAETGPTATVPPGYPYFLSLLMRLAGEGIAFAVLRCTLAAIAVSAQYALLPGLAQAIGVRRSVGFLGGLAGAALPIRQWIETAGGHENAYAGLALLVLFRLSIPLWSERSWKYAALCGAAWGAGLLLSPALLPAMAAVLVVAPWRNRRLLLNSAVAAVGAVAILVPWTIRNYVALGALVPMRSSFGLELAIANSDTATGIETWNMRSWTHPYTQVAEAEKMRRMGEVAYYAMRKKQGVDWIRAHPAGFVHLTILRVVYFWFTPVYGRVKGMFMDLLTAGGILGLIFLLRARSPHAPAMAAIWLLFPLPYYLLHVSPRYRYPIDWMFWLLASYAVWTLVTEFLQRPSMQRYATTR